MNEEYKNNISENHEIDIFDLVDRLWTSKKIIIYTTLIFSLIGVVYSLSLSNIYKSSTVLTGIDDSNSITKLARQYSSLASLAGIQTGNALSAGSDPLQEGIEILESFDFFETFVEKNKVFFELAAINGWDEKNNTLIVNPKIYDEKNKIWVFQNKFSKNGKPTIQFVHREFLKDLSITANNITGFITISYKHYSPHFSKRIVELLVHDINEMAKLKSIKQAEESIKFLENEIQGTQLTDVRVGLNNLIQSQIENKMVANASPEYLFKTLSPPIAPEKRDSPSRIIICCIFFFAGLLISIFYLILRFIVEEVYSKPSND